MAGARPLIDAAFLAYKMCYVWMNVFLLNIHDNLNFNNHITFLIDSQKTQSQFFEIIPSEHQLHPLAVQLLLTDLSKGLPLCI
jgi:hypothetical protein